MFTRRPLRFSIVFALVCLLTGAFSLSAAAAPAVAQSSGVYWFADASPVPGAWSTLRRNDNGVTMTLHTTGLDPGATYTVWWVVFNNPAACTHGAGDLQCGEGDLAPFGGDPAVMSSALWATGHVVGNDGVATFAARLNVGRTHGQVLFGDGLLNAHQAEIHLVVRSHGAPIPGMVKAQTHTFEGGCEINVCVDQQFAAFPAP